MEVVPHQAVRAKVPRVGIDDPLEQDEQHLAIRVVAEDDHAAVTTRKRVMSTVERVTALLESHDLESSEASEIRPGTQKAGSDRPWIWGMRSRCITLWSPSAMRSPGRPAVHDRYAARAYRRGEKWVAFHRPSG